MARTRFIKVVCIALTIHSAEAMAWNCDKGPKDFFLYDTVPQARTAGVNYSSELSAAFRKETAALITLLKLTAAGKLDGAGAQTHTEVLWGLLQCWGDSAFSDVLDLQPTKVRSRVLRSLLDATAETRSSRAPYPRTLRLAMK